MKGTDVSATPCEQHTDAPEGYVVWHAWAAEMNKTHRQRKCAGCGRWSIWEKRVRAGAGPNDGTET